MRCHQRLIDLLNIRHVVWCVVLALLFGASQASSQTLTDYRRLDKPNQQKQWLKVIKKANELGKRIKSDNKSETLSDDLIKTKAQRKLSDLFEWQSINLEHRAGQLPPLTGNWIGVVDSAFHLPGFPVLEWQWMSKAQQNGLIRSGSDSTHYFKTRNVILIQISKSVRQSDSVGFLRSWSSYLRKHPGYLSDSVIVKLEQAIDTLLYRRVALSRDIKLLEQYLVTYPNSVLKSSAEDLLDDLIFIKEAGDGRLVNLRKYVQQHPSSKYNQRISDRIFKLQLANSAPDSLPSLIKSNNLRAKQAAVINRLLLAQVGKEQSLVPYILPLNKGKFDWCFAQDSSRTFYQSDTIEDEVCERGWPLAAYNFPIREVKFRRIGLARDTIIAVDSLAYLGIGWYKLTHGSRTWLYHPSDLSIDDSVADAEVLDNRFLLVRHKAIAGQQEKYRLYNFWGQPLLLAQTFDEIELDEGYLILTRGGLKSLLPLERLQAIEENGQLGIAFQYNELDYQGDNLWLALKGDFTSLISSSGKRLLPLRRQRLSKGPAQLWISEFQDSQGAAFEVYNTQGRMLLAQPAFAIKAAANAVAYKTTKGWGVIGADGSEWQPSIWDTVTVLNRSVMIVSQGNTRLFSLGTGNWQVLPQRARVEPLAAAAASSKVPFSHFAQYDSTNQVTVLNGRGRLVPFVGFKTVNKVWVPQAGYFACRGLVENTIETVQTVKSSKRKKKSVTKKEVVLSELVGLYDTLGNQILSPTYDGITDGSDNNLMLVAKSTFGLYQTSTKRLIKPAYQQAVRPVTLNVGGKSITYYLIKQSDQFMLIDQDAHQVNLPAFDQIEQWGDNKLMVRRADTVRFVTDFSASRPIVSEPLKLVRTYDTQSKFMILSSFTDSKVGLYSYNRVNAVLAQDYQRIYWRKTETGYLVFAIKPSLMGRVKLEVYNQQIQQVAVYEAGDELIGRLTCTAAD